MVRDGTDGTFELKCSTSVARSRVIIYEINLKVSLVTSNRFNCE